MRFSHELEKVLSQIPEGRVTTFGEVAKALGDVRASKAVSDFLAGNRQRSHRVVNAQGKARPWQIESLKNDGIAVIDGRIRDLDHVLFRDLRAECPLKLLREEQREVAGGVVLEDDFEDVKNVCGFDLAYEDDRAVCAFAVVDVKNLDVIEKDVVVKEIDFPYIPSYLTYREYPAIRAAFERVRSDVDVLLIDGHGYSHPRRAGIGCHVGVKLGKPTIGVAKSLLVGKTRTPSKVGDSERVLHNDETIGYALRSSTSKRPIYVSPGHLVSFESSVRIVKSLCKTRIPEPLRQAHLAATAGKGG